MARVDRIQYIAVHVRILIGLAIFLAAQTSRGAYSNHNSVLLGERAAGLGGAFTALTGDSSATAYYNPATTILMTRSSLSASVNLYNKFETVLGDASGVDGAPQRVNRGYFRSLPSSSGTVLHFKSFTLGLSILVPDYDFYSGQVRGPTSTNSYLSQIDESLWVGGSFSTRLTLKDSVGLTMYYTARNLSRTVSDRQVNSGGTGEVITNEEKNLTANSVVGVFGYHRKLSPLWSFGVSYRPPSLPISGDGTYYRSITQTTPYSAQTINRANLRTLTKIPSRIGFGIAREVKDETTLSVDLQYFEGQSYLDFPELGSGADQVRYRQLVNFAIGYEETLKDWLSLRVGFFTNRSAHPSPDPNLPYRQGDFVDMNGFSANLQVTTEENTSFTFGGYYTSGQGQTIQLVGQNLTVIPKTQQVFTMLIATGFAF